jgi:general secretion pathway protein N
MKSNLTPLAFVVLGIVGYAIFLAAQMPASALLAAAQRAEPGKFDVREAGGSAWRGNAKLTLHAPGGDVAIDRLEWRWRPARLLAGRMAFDVTAAASGLEAAYEGARSLTRWEVRDAKARASAAAVAALAPWIAPWRPEGEVTLTSPRLESDGRELRGAVRVEWKGAAVALSDVKPLGSYRADIDMQGPGAGVSVTTLDGPLRVSGKGTLAPPGRVTFAGEARGEGAAAAALAPLLKLMGAPRADGAHAIDWRAP